MDGGIHFHMAAMLVHCMASCSGQLEQAFGAKKPETTHSVMAGCDILPDNLHVVFFALPPLELSFRMGFPGRLRRGATIQFGR